VNKLWSRWEYFWKATFLTTGGSWWRSPIRMQRFSRLCPSSGRWSSMGMNVSDLQNLPGFLHHQVVILEPQTPLKSFLFSPCRGCRSWPHFLAWRPMRKAATGPQSS